MTWHAGCCSGTSAGQTAQADEGAGDAGEGEEVFGLAFVAAMKAATGGQLGNGPLYDPAVAAQPLGTVHSLAGDPVPDATCR